MMKTKTNADTAPAQVGSWKVTEELDSIQCPICKGYNRLSVSSDKSIVYCAECGDTITEAYLATQGFDLRQALKREASPAIGQHTPGPWTYIPSQVTGPVWTVLHYGNPIADLPQDTNDSEANARLIAAAPELLEALKKLLRADEMPPGIEQAQKAVAAMATARAAIAKAERWEA